MSRPGARRGAPGGSRRPPGAAGSRARPERGPARHGLTPARPGLGGEQVEGRQAVRELLAAGRRPVRRLWMAGGLEPSAQLDQIEDLAARRRVPVETVSRPRLDGLARTESHQGVVAQARPVEEVPLEELAAGRGPGSGDPVAFLLVVAGVTDPHNLGSLLRSAECAGVQGVVLARHRAARLTPTATKVAAGAVEHLRFSAVGGIPAALAELGRLGVFVLGLASEGRRSLYDLDLGDRPIALVVGSEEKGLPPLARRRCDELAAIPQHGALPSLNVGVAGALAAFEVARQRAAGPGDR